MAQKLFVFLFFFISTHCWAEESQTSITNKIAAIAKKTNSIIGVSAVYIEKDKKVSYNGTMPFFMASTSKVLIALTLLNRVDEKKENLHRIVHLNPNNPTPGSGGIAYKLDKDNLDISLMQLLKLMLIRSDNSASDALFEEVKGPRAVQNRLNALGFSNIKVNRTFLEIFFDIHGANPALMKLPHTTAELTKAFNQVPMSKKTLTWKQLDNDWRDKTTPNDMAQLLVQLFKGKLLSPASTELLIDIMEQCKTGRNRIRKLLPAGTKVAHKTGTWSLKFQNASAQKLYGFTSDIGIIALPQNKGHIAIAVYVKSPAGDHTRATAIALTSRAIYDHFVPNAPPPPKEKPQPKINKSKTPKKVLTRKKSNIPKKVTVKPVKPKKATPKKLRKKT